MVQLMGPFNSGDAVGADGSATNSQDTPVLISGMLEAVYVKYNPAYPDNPPAGTKVTIGTKGLNGAAPTLDILILTSANADGWFFPRALIDDPAGSAVAGLYDHMPIYDLVNVEIDLANAGNSVDVWLLVS